MGTVKDRQKNKLHLSTLWVYSTKTLNTYNTNDWPVAVLGVTRQQRKQNERERKSGKKRLESQKSERRVKIKSRSVNGVTSGQRVSSKWPGGTRCECCSLIYCSEMGARIWRANEWVTLFGPSVTRDAASGSFHVKKETQRHREDSVAATVVFASRVTHSEKKGLSAWPLKSGPRQLLV